MSVDLSWRYCIIVDDRPEHVVVGDSILEGQNELQAWMQYEEFTRAVVWRAILQDHGRVLRHVPVNTKAWGFTVPEEVKKYWRLKALQLNINFTCNAFPGNNIRVQDTEINPWVM